MAEHLFARVPCLLVVVAWWATGSLTAQADPVVVELDRRVECPDCRVRLERAVQLEAAGNLVIGSRIARLPGGGYVATTGDPVGVAVFDDSGKHRFTFGRRGSGPGEFLEVVDLAVSNDGILYVVDLGNGCVHAFRADSLSALDAFSAPSPLYLLPTRRRAQQVIPLGGDTLAVLEVASDAVTVTGPDWTHPLAFGQSRPANGFEMFRVLGVGKDRTIWTGRRDRYQVDGYSPAGRHLHVLRATGLDWFQPLDPKRPERRASIMAVQGAGGGTLWILIRRMKSGWQAVPDGARGPAGAVPEGLAASEFVLELLDVAAGTRVVSSLLDGLYPGGFLSSDLLYSYEEDETGAVRAGIWRIVPPLGLSPGGFLSSEEHQS